MNHSTGFCFLSGRCLPVMVLALAVSFSPHLSAAIIGTNTPAPPLTRQRIATLPAAQQAVWTEYLKHSERQWQADQSLLRTEMRNRGMHTPMVPPTGFSARSTPLNEPASWYGSKEAARIANIIVSFQTPAGGWSKNLNLAKQARVPGESFAPDNDSRLLGQSDFDSLPAGHWDYVGTFDNNATVTELRFLAKVITAGETNQVKPFGTSFERGLDYIFAAQYPNGGWPQVWPLQGGYHDAITYNDDAMINILGLLREVAIGTNDFAFVPETTRRLAAASLQRGLACVLACQIIEDGHPTVWCQQHDALTLEPVSARNYEMPSEVSGESAAIMMFLMAQPHPGPEIIESVNAAAAWFEKTQIRDMAFKVVPGLGHRLVPAPGHRPIWARYYQIGADRPIFGDRDKTIHDHLNEISDERRNGYAWFTAAPQTALERYAGWKEHLSE
ncbi:MAG TPA: pectate lyase [Verrucomicrobiae bacterium]|nr:pectate lyase [Verrucomicrobiae bacterium]